VRKKENILKSFKKIDFKPWNEACINNWDGYGEYYREWNDENVYEPYIENMNLFTLESLGGKGIHFIHFEKLITEPLKEVQEISKQLIQLGFEINEEKIEYAKNAVRIS
jgi:hypothetical protein